LQEVKGLKTGESQQGSRGAHTPPGQEGAKRKGKGKRKVLKREGTEERMGSSL
jgi:hypothetical protein